MNIKKMEDEEKEEEGEHKKRMIEKKKELEEKKMLSRQYVQQINNEYEEKIKGINIGIENEIKATFLEREIKWKYFLRSMIMSNNNGNHNNEIPTFPI
jgi:hypothetical protein